MLCFSALICVWQVVHVFADCPYCTMHIVAYRYVASGPLVRSSYRAGELFLKGMLEAK